MGRVSTNDVYQELKLSLLNGQDIEEFLGTVILFPDIGKAAVEKIPETALSGKGKYDAIWRAVYELAKSNTNYSARDVLAKVQQLYGSDVATSEDIAGLIDSVIGKDDSIVDRIALLHRLTIPIARVIGLYRSIKSNIIPLVEIDDAIDSIVEATNELISASSRGDISHATMPDIYDGRGFPIPWPGYRDIIPVALPGELHIIAARPGVGKTTMALWGGWWLARHGIKTGIISMEMSQESLNTRGIAMLSGVPFYRIASGNLTREERVWIEHVAGMWETENLLFIKPKTHHLTDLLSALKRMFAFGVRVIFVDYLQLFTTRRANSRDREIAVILSEVLALAKETGAVIFALSQLNRGSERGESVRPKLSHLRESGSIENDADVVAFLVPLYRVAPTWKGITELVIAKSRNGRTGTALISLHAPPLMVTKLERELIAADSAGEPW